jgi:hypothetical protein
MVAANSKRVVGTRGMDDEAVYDWLKLLSARYRREQPSGFNGKFLILPPGFAEAAQLNTTPGRATITELFDSVRHHRRDKNLCLREYDKLFIMGFIPDRPAQDGHFCLIVVWFRGHPHQKWDEIVIKSYDTDHYAEFEEIYDSQMRGIMYWLEAEWLKRPTYKYKLKHGHKQPVQHDGWNCGY